MKPGRIEELLHERGESVPSSALTPGFAPGVLRRARQFRAAMIRHRRWLLVSSVIAMGIALLISASLGSRPEVIPPPFDEFRTPVFSSPAPRP